MAFMSPANASHFSISASFAMSSFNVLIGRKSVRLLHLGSVTWLALVGYKQRLEIGSASDISIKKDIPGLVPWFKKENERNLAELPKQFRPAKSQAAHRAISCITNWLLLKETEFAFIIQQLLTDTKKDSKRNWYCITSGKCTRPSATL